MLTNSYTPSARAQVITRRTYSRPLNDEGTVFETWEQTVDRVIQHQRWLWERAKGDQPLLDAEHTELEKLRELMLDRKISVSGRTLWLGGTPISKKREASQFNCSFGRVETVHDVVDAFWLLLQGCGVGFEPVVGNLSGFTKSVELEVRRSQRHLLAEPKGIAHNTESMTDGEWHLMIGDSAEAWAKAVGKLLAQKQPLNKIILDFSQIRPAGQRLKGYGWISSGDETYHLALTKIVELMNKRAGQLLDRIDILDVMNWLGTTLSSRRSAEIALVPYGDPQWKEFAAAKKDHWIDNPQRAQSNNSIVFYSKPSKEELSNIFQMMMDAGGSEPGFINGEAALKRAPWFKGCNPCAEILLGNKSFCNLVEIDLAKFNDDWKGLIEAMRIAARANYRQTCVNLVDGVLQRSWHELNEFLRLCGVGVTGVVRWEKVNDGLAWYDLKNIARDGAFSMADELGLPRPKAVTTVKPSGTLSKIMDTTEGLHKPLGKYIFNNVRFSIHDPIIKKLKKAGYHIFNDPYSSDSLLVRFPVAWENVEFDVDPNTGKAVNNESAVDQLNRYKMLMTSYVDHNASVTISYSPDEADAIVDWVHENWDAYVGVSFLYRTDPSKTAEDLGYPYLPQEVVDQETFYAYANKLKPVDLSSALASTNLTDEADEASLSVDSGDECATGACPIR
jgi:adenosylcobalamin-dependent ribonucleoside-triphosphate reductase